MNGYNKCTLVPQCKQNHPNLINIVTAFHILAQIYSANHATFPKQIYTIKVYISGNLTFKVLSKYAAEACKE